MSSHPPHPFGVVMIVLPTPEVAPVRGCGSSEVIHRDPPPTPAAPRGSTFSFSAATRNETQKT